MFVPLLEDKCVDLFFIEFLIKLVGSGGREYLERVPMDVGWVVGAVCGGGSVVRVKVGDTVDCEGDYGGSM